MMHLIAVIANTLLLAMNKSHFSNMDISLNFHHLCSVGTPFGHEEK